MALVVESTSTASGNDQDTLTITKPTGVVTGDLLVIIASGLGNYSGDPAYPTCTGFSEGGTASVDNPGTLPDVAFGLLYRIADASDEAATNYTVGLSGTNSQGVATMFRISGWSTGNPIYASASNGTYFDSSTPTDIGSSGLSISRPSASLLFEAGMCYSTNSPRTSATFAGYSVTTSASNPTWTEVVDTFVSTDGNFSYVSFAVAYANDSDTSDITAYGVTATGDTSGTSDGYLSALFVICQPVNDSDSNTLLTTDGTIFTQTGTTDGSGSNTLLTTGGTIQSQAGTAGDNPHTPVNKSSATWSNASKS